MPVIQIDKNGFIKGTKRKYVMKVIVKKAMMVKGAFVPVGAVLDLEGAFLAECLSYNKVEPIIESPVPDDKTENDKGQLSNESESSDVSPLTSDNKKKLGPKKKKKVN